MAEQNSVVPLDCSICGRRFDRSEHLKRHIHTHSRERSFDCRKCGRRFSRKDALDRHDKVHRAQAPLRRFRACCKCASSRVKCSGTLPCSRCQKNTWICAFPEGSIPTPSLSGSDVLSDPVSNLSGDSGLGAASSMHLNGHRQSSLGRPQYSHGALQPGLDESLPNAVPQLPIAADFGRSQMSPLRLDQYQIVSQHHYEMPYSQDQQAPTFNAANTQQPSTLEFMASDMDTHMISDLNWISPSFDFTISNFDYDAVDTTNQQWQDSAVEQSVSPDHSTTAQEAVPETRSTTDSHTPVAEPSGASYIDDTGSRRPRNGRYANQIFNDPVTPRSIPECTIPLDIAEEPGGYSFPPQRPLDNSGSKEQGSSARPIQPEEYRTLAEAFRDLCLDSSVSDYGSVYESARFPPMDTFDTLLYLYRQHFDPLVIPLIHESADKQQKRAWIVILAQAAIGSHFASPFNTELCIALHEMLRREVRRRSSSGIADFSRSDQINMLQAKFLNYIGLAYSGSARLKKHQSAALDCLVGDFLALYQTSGLDLRGHDAEVNSDQQRWLFSESLRRICHCIWLLETMSRYHFDTQPRLLLDYADIALPCHEQQWRCTPETAWLEHVDVSLEKALRVLYVEKRLVKGVGDFARILIIHGLYCQTWDIARSLTRPLLRWTPTAQKGNAESEQLTGPTFLPKIALYNHWRNSACDCLDVLHWIANSDIAKSGTENTTVLHLHYARIVLLTPFKQIRRLAECVASDDLCSTEALQCFEAVRRWIMEDQFKARLALVHCGVLFWHVRRYSTDAFYESANVYMAALVVWIYGTLCSSPALGLQRSELRSRSGEESSDLDAISSIRLDRPTDDELVQLFIKRGRTMKATISGVGSITAVHGPIRMLREGCRVLSALPRWGNQQQQLHALLGLADACSRRAEWLSSLIRARAKT